MNKLNYSSPELTDFGSITGITAVRGQEAVYDVEVNSAGSIVDEGTQSVDLCWTGNQADCDAAVAAV